MPTPPFCRQCARAGVETLADYIYQPEETTLTGPMMGDPDYRPPIIAEQDALCKDHFAGLTADRQLDYVPAPFHGRQGA